MPKICGLCSKHYEEFGNNSQPLAASPDVDRCCDDCDAHYVVPARLLSVTFGSPEAVLLQAAAAASPVGKLAHTLTDWFNLPTEQN